MSGRLGVTPGDPRGVGPEVACKAIAAWPDPLDVVLVGEEAAIVRAARAVDLRVARVPTLTTAVSDAVPYWVPPPGEPVEVAAVRAVTQACLAGTLAGLVTGPIHKARLGAQGFPYPGHTDFLGHLCGVERPVMAFVGGGLRVALVTVHLPLREVADAVTTAAVGHTLDAVARASAKHLGLSAPRIAVCGLNPHAGDDGLLGDEDRDQIAPAVAAARARGVDAVGPISSETAFRWAASGRVHWVVAMYHDQGLAPLKLVDFGRSVNWTLGLPIVRTSVDHGTADDIAGQGIADPASMTAALSLAQRVTAANG